MTPVIIVYNSVIIETGFADVGVAVTVGGPQICSVERLGPGHGPPRPAWQGHGATAGVSLSVTVSP